MKSNQAANASTASLSSYAGSTSSLTGGNNKSPAIGSHEAMPSIRARLAKNGGARPTPTRTAGANGITTPHQNPVKMVQEMVGRVKVRFIWGQECTDMCVCKANKIVHVFNCLFFILFLVPCAQLVFGGATCVLSLIGDTTAATSTLLLNLHPSFDTSISKS